MTLKGDQKNSQRANDLIFIKNIDLFGAIQRPKQILFY